MNSLILLTSILGLICSINAQVSVSGLSSGAFAAVQYHISYSSQLDGAGIVAGGPFWCAQGSVVTAITTCMSLPSGIVLSTLISQTASYASSGLIDPTSNLQDQKVWLFSGTADSVVNPGVMKALDSYYSNYVSADNMLALFNYSAQHSMPTNDFGNACSFLGSPYISNCNFDAAGSILQHIYGPLKNKHNSTNSNIETIAQAQFLPSGWTASSASVGPNAYFYLPSAGCINHSCKLHIAFHGCQQTLADIGMDFVENTDYNNWAEANHIIVVYPQAVKSYFPTSNPNGCWDWWGYTNANYATNKGVQNVMVNNMVNYFKSKYNIA